MHGEEDYKQNRDHDRSDRHHASGRREEDRYHRRDDVAKGRHTSERMRRRSRSREREDSLAREELHRHRHREKSGRGAEKYESERRGSRLLSRKGDHERHSDSSNRSRVSEKKSSRDEKILRPLPKNVEKITPDDYAKYAPEFRLWLQREKRMILFDIPKDQARNIFRREFVPDWNDGVLDPIYYSGDDSKILDASEGLVRTSHRWNIRISGTEADELETVADSVAVASISSNTFARSVKEESERSSRESKRDGHSSRDDRSKKYADYHESRSKKYLSKSIHSEYD